MAAYMSCLSVLVFFCVHVCYVPPLVPLSFVSKQAEAQLGATSARGCEKAWNV